MTMGHWRAVHQVHLEDGLKFGLSAWIHFAGTSTPLQKCEISPLFLQRSCVCSCSPGLSGSSRNVPAHFPYKKVQCWVPNLEMIRAFLQSWSLQNPTNLSGPGIEERIDEAWAVPTPEKNLIRQWTSGHHFFPTFSLLVYYFQLYYVSHILRLSHVG